MTARARSVPDWLPPLRERLLGLAYRMLGSVSDAEDVVQEALLRWHQADTLSVANPSAWLTTTVTRLAIDQLRSARRRRETYPGPWLPEPWPMNDTPPADQTTALAESLSLAMLLLMESLDPVERAVYLLRAVFAYDYAEIATIVDRSQPNCRQLFHRAEGHLATGRARPLPPLETQRELTQAFLTACATGDLAALSDRLAADVVAWSDGGGRVAAARVPVRGREAVMRYVLGVTRKGLAGARIELRQFNGQWAVAAIHNDTVTNLVFLEWDNGRVTAIRTQRNPDKLARITPAAPAGDWEG